MVKTVISVLIAVMAIFVPLLKLSQFPIMPSATVIAVNATPSIPNFPYSVVIPFITFDAPQPVKPINIALTIGFNEPLLFIKFTTPATIPISV